MTYWFLMIIFLVTLVYRVRTVQQQKVIPLRAVDPQSEFCLSQQRFFLHSLVMNWTWST